MNFPFLQTAPTCPFDSKLCDKYGDEVTKKGVKLDLIQDRDKVSVDLIQNRI